jgi:hypothetical protein
MIDVGAAETADVIDVGETVDDAAVSDCFAAQPASHTAETMTMPASARVRGTPIVSNFIAMRTARVYDDPDPDDGIRVLVDRLWPRGLRKQDPRVGRWCRRRAVDGVATLV